MKRISCVLAIVVGLGAVAWLLSPTGAAAAHDRDFRLADAFLPFRANRGKQRLAGIALPMGDRLGFWDHFRHFAAGNKAEVEQITFIIGRCILTSGINSPPACPCES